MSHCHPWHRAGNQRPLVRRAADIPPPQEPPGAEALNQVTSERLGLVEASGDDLYVIFCERKVPSQALGVILVRASAKRTRHRTVEVSGHSSMQ